MSQTPLYQAGNSVADEHQLEGKRSVYQTYRVSVVLENAAANQ
jgi:hypothetical protein